MLGGGEDGVEFWLNSTGGVLGNCWERVGRGEEIFLWGSEVLEDWRMLEES